jgi:bifunctional DNase/RNase
MVGSIFHAKLYLRTKDGEEKIIDARPSDSIALAVRSDAPIFVEEEVLDRAAISKVEDK